jgi:hypothetical protein
MLCFNQQYGKSLRSQAESRGYKDSTKVYESIRSCNFCSHSISIPNDFAQALLHARQMMNNHDAYWIEVMICGATLDVIPNDNDILEVLFQSCKQ